VFKSPKLCVTIDWHFCCKCWTLISSLMFDVFVTRVRCFVTNIKCFVTNVGCFYLECSMLSSYLRAMLTVTLANESQPRQLLSRQSTKKYSFDFNCLYKTFYLAYFFTLYTLTVLVAPRSFLLDSLLSEYYLLL
jgi:hypothetical protein